MSTSNRMLALFGRRVTGLLTILCLICAGGAYCQLANQSPATPPITIDMPHQINEAVRSIIPSPTSANAVLIGDQQRNNLLDLPGRLIVLSGTPYQPAGALMQNYRRSDCKLRNEEGTTKPPVRATRLECVEEKAVSVMGQWFGADIGRARKCLVELTATPMPATSMSTIDLDSDKVQELISKLPLETRCRLGIITSVTPYEVYASLGVEEAKPTKAGVWYLKTSKNWYCKTQNEQRLYYLVAVYVPPITPDEALKLLPPSVASSLPENKSIDPAFTSSIISPELLQALVKSRSDLPKFGERTLAIGPIPGQ